MRAEDAILHGCIPVIIMDNVQTVFESILEWEKFSVRVKESEVHLLPQLLAAYTDDQILELQKGIAEVWTRSSGSWFEGRQDALSTMMAWLLSRVVS
eukprot:gene2473-5423_t